ncbi:MAG: fibronectin type III domain-containing protein, partial [Thermoguttaceae bacterium]|nr:fibronectin type III domain-containing protein [Thermoguttaceae bacterium]
MKRNSSENRFFDYFRSSKQTNQAQARSLRMESLEERQLLSVTDVAFLAAAEADQPAEYTAAAPVSDDAIDVSSVLATTAGYNADDLAALVDLGIAATGYEATFAWNDAGRLVGIDFTKWNPLSPTNSVAGRSFDVTAFPELTNVVSTNCSIAGLKVAGLTKLETLQLNGNAIQSLDLTGCSALKTVYCSGNNLGSLNLGDTALTLLQCDNNNLTALDLSAGAALTELSCAGNAFTEIDATPCVNLGSINFYNSALEAVYLAPNAPVLVGLQANPGSSELAVVDRAGEAVATTTETNGYSFSYDSANGPYLATLTFDGGATQNISIGPLFVLDKSENSEPVYAVVSENVALADIIAYNLTDPEFSATVEGYTAEQSAELVKVENGQLVYIAGLAASDTPYNITVTVVDGAKSGSANFALTVQEYQLATPADFQADSFTDSSVTLSWTDVEYADGYTVAYGEGEDAVSNTYSEGPVTIDNLEPYTTYTFTLAAVREGLKTSDPATVTVTTDKAEFPDFTIAASPITADSITFTWDAIGGASSLDYVFGQLTDSLAGDATSAVFSNLEANTEYTFDLTVHGDAYYDKVVSVTATTAKADFAPFTVSAAGATANSLTFTWDAVAGAEGYSYVCGDQSGTLDADATSVTVEELSANTEYTFTLTASAANYNDASASVTARTSMETLATPTGFAVSAATESTISLTWTDVANATGYTVELVDGDVAVATQSVNDVAATFEGLDANTEYTFRVQATTLGMNPSDYAYVTGHTDMATLDAPTNLTAAATDTTVTLTWDAVEGAAAYFIEGYGETSDTTFTVDELDANTEYTFSVIATADAMYPSAPTTAVVTTEKATLAAPTDLAADADVNSVTLTWTA